MVEIGILPEGFVGQSPAQIHLRKKYQVLVIAIRQTGRAEREFMPSAELVLQKGNTMIPIGKEADIARFKTSERG